MPEMTLADFIGANMEPILEAWEEFAKEIISARHLDRGEARDHAKGIVLAIAADLDRAQTLGAQAEKSKGRGPRTPRESQAKLHGAARGATGFSIDEELAEFRALRASIVRLWTASLTQNGNNSAFDQLTRFNEAIDQALAESVSTFSAEKMKESNLFNTLLSSSPDFHYIFGLDGRFIYANPALTDMHEMSLKEIVGKNLFDLDSPFAAEFHQHLAQVIATREPYRGDLSHTFPAGNEVTYECIVVPVINAEGIVEAVAGTAREMSERKQLEKDLLREMTISDTIIESAPGGFFMLDEQTNLVRWNKYLRDETGMSDEQLRGFSILSAIHEDDRPLAAATFMAAFATGYARMEVRCLTLDRGIRCFLKTARRVVLNGVPYLAGFGIDITERKLSEAALAKEKLFSDALIESVPGAFYVVDMECNYIRWNSYLNRLTGLAGHELLHRPMLLTFHAEDRPLAAAAMKDAFEKGYGQAEVRVLTHDRGSRPFFLTARRFQVGAAAYLVGVGSDITEWLVRMKALEHEAWTDPLTQIANRGHFLDMATQEFARCRRYGHPLSVWMLDIDHFKAVNDTYGHQAGDIVLQSLVSTSQQALRDWDILGRMGGEEFAVLLPETESGQSLQVAERLRHAVATASGALENGESARITISIGVATAHDDDADLATLIKRSMRPSEPGGTKSAWRNGEAPTEHWPPDVEDDELERSVCRHALLRLRRVGCPSSRPCGLHRSAPRPD